MTMTKNHIMITGLVVAAVSGIAMNQINKKGKFGPLKKNDTTMVLLTVLAFAGGVSALYSIAK